MQVSFEVEKVARLRRFARLLDKIADRAFIHVTDEGVRIWGCDYGFTHVLLLEDINANSTHNFSIAGEGELHIGVNPERLKAAFDALPGKDPVEVSIEKEGIALREGNIIREISAMVTEDNHFRYPDEPLTSAFFYDDTAVDALRAFLLSEQISDFAVVEFKRNGLLHIGTPPWLNEYVRVLFREREDIVSFTPKPEEDIAIMIPLMHISWLKSELKKAFHISIYAFKEARALQLRWTINFGEENPGLSLASIFILGVVR